MEVQINSKITISDPSKAVRDYCEETLQIPNPEFYKKQKMGKWTGGTPEHIQLFEKRGQDYVLPFGCLRDIWGIVRDAKKWSDNFAHNGRVYYKSSITPYDYQALAIRAICDRRNGVVVMPCGSGKTQTALAAIAELGLKCLWITHTGELLKQSMERAKECLVGNWGTITGGKVNISTHITFATIQTLVNLNLSDYADQWDMVVVDECHKAIGAPTRVHMFYKVLSALRARYKIGLTATPERSDGMERCMYALLGECIYEAGKECTTAATVPILVNVCATGYTPATSEFCRPDGTIDFSKAIDAMTRNYDRNRYITEIVRQQPEKSFLILSDRISHLQALYAMFDNAGIKGVTKLHGRLVGEAARKGRECVMEHMRSGEKRILLATYALAKEGLDIPRLDAVLFATPKKDYASVVQACGRCGRKFGNKVNGEVFDLVDNFSMYYRMSGERHKHYRKMGYGIC